MGHLVWRVEHFDEIDSTNTYVARAARDGASEGLVAVARYQREGKGRLDRSWEAPPDSSLLTSILLRPPSDVDAQLAVAAVALAARAALERACGVAAALKWPNDLVVGERKVAGVLAELVMASSGRALVVGLGLNLTYHGPNDTTSTSVEREGGTSLTPDQLLVVVLEELTSRRSFLDDTAGRTTLRGEYVTALTTLGRAVRVELADGVLRGVAVGLSDDGALVVETNDERRVVRAGDVIHLRLESDVDA